ncbi:putative metal resistance protein [Yersinia bercovieri]|uniref:Copper resistance protein n=2 Tax=Yersinia bercovieri TaxID=634 RepID=A0A2G4U5Q9_YERBE|nr:MULTISPECIES: DsbA family protein [Yersinia]PHZ28637.1 copper resistance protein [Yersinia bercovieri]QDW32784.1 DsbA family protein [Yersinia sp. KBS0713]QKJ08813.1 DsbA family protein [Yersinia bercovieri ATCC 43970]CFQ31681.1 putative metal resistance protein [Yersinia bercovieri]CNF81837.1 putative metal resistance protein [Yersinia bercovieri]
MKILMILLLALIATPLWAAEPFTPAQELRIKALIRETLVANPDILEQSVNAWQQQANQAQGQQLSQFIAANQQALYLDPASPRFGAAKPALTLVSFTDYNCPFCKTFDPLLEKIVQEYPQLAVVIKPLPFKGESSVTSARLALTLWQQHPDQFMAFHQRLMTKKGLHDANSIAAAQKKTGVTPVEPSEQSLNVLRSNLKLADQLGIQGTPATLIGDQLVPGAISYQQLEEIVKQQLASVDK